MTGIELLAGDTTHQREASYQTHPGWFEFQKQPPDLPRFDSATHKPLQFKWVTNTACITEVTDFGALCWGLSFPFLSSPRYLWPGYTPAQSHLYSAAQPATSVQLPSLVFFFLSAQKLPSSYPLNQDSCCGHQLLLIELELKG